MALAERRAVQEFETNQLPALKERVEKAAGFSVPLEISWDTLAVTGESRLYAESWPAVYFEPLVGALEWVGRDNMGREAIQSEVKKIVLQNTKGCTNPDCWAAFHDGVLTLDHEAITNVHDVDGRRKALIAVLEQGL
jgi:hypothetical protein